MTHQPIRPNFLRPLNAWIRSALTGSYNSDDGGVREIKNRKGVDASKSVFLDSFGITVDEQSYGWSIGHEDAVVLLREAERFLQKGSISYIEFGFGLSTRIMMQYLKHAFPGFNLFSLEADPEYFREAQKWAAGVETTPEQKLEILHAPYNKDTKLFELDVIGRLLQEAHPDLLFVDAPPDTNTADARLKTLQKITPYLHQKSIIAIHDTKRIDELYAFHTIKDRFIDFETIDTPKGIAVLRFPKESATCI